MSTQQRRSSGQVSKGIKGLTGAIALLYAFGLFVFQLSASIGLAFSQSPWSGLRSLAAALFPISVVIYLGLLAQVQIPSRESRAPIINSFIVFMFWTMLILGLDGSNELVFFPLEELLYSTTLAIMIWRYQYRGRLNALLACCYGVLSGSLAALILFGVNPIAM
jgi:hypothetical protein